MTVVRFVPGCRQTLLLAGLVGVFAGWMSLQAAPATASSGRLKAAIFVQNRAGPAWSAKADTLRELVAARLAEKGFTLIDAKDVVKGLGAAADDASLLRTTQSLGADYLAVATLASVGTTTRKLLAPPGSGLNTETEVSEVVMRLTLKVAEGRQGGSVYGDVVTVTDRIGSNRYLLQRDGDVDNRLLDAGAAKLAENVASRVAVLPAVAGGVGEDQQVLFGVICNVPGVDVSLDGVVVGSAGGKLAARPGLHAMAVTREGFQPWRRTVNIQAGVTLNVTLELSEDGLAKYKDIEGFKRFWALAEEQSAAEAYRKRTVADGEKKMLEQSRFDVKTIKEEHIR